MPERVLELSNVWDPAVFHGEVVGSDALLVHPLKQRRNSELEELCGLEEAEDVGDSVIVAEIRQVAVQVTPDFSDKAN